MDNVQKARETLLQLKEKIHELEVMWKTLNAKQSSIDKMIVQLEHEIEIQNLDAVGMAKKYKELKGIFRLRRKYKNEIEVISTTRSLYSENNINTCISNFNKSKDGQATKRFKDRITEEVRKELLKEIELMREESK